MYDLVFVVSVMICVRGLPSVFCPSAGCCDKREETDYSFGFFLSLCNVSAKLELWQICFHQGL